MQVVYGRFERPRIVSKYIVEVQAKERSWRDFLNFATMTILPTHEIAELDGATFLSQYQFRTLVGSGPYILRPSDVKMQHTLSLRRRDDYWGANERFAVGQYNFDTIRLISTKDSVLALEKAKKGEMDLLKIGKARDWAVDLPRLSQVQRGLLVLQRIHNDQPSGADGIVINMRRPPLDDVRVRKALCHLYNRRKLIEKLFYGEYEHLDGYFSPTMLDEVTGAIDLNEAEPELIRYDPDAAQRLLAEAGWSERDSQGLLVKNGRRMELELIYSSKVVERYLSVFQEDCRRAGIVINLKQLTRASRFQTTYGNRQFQVATQGWGGTLDPNPQAAWLSVLADRNNNNNFAGFKSEQVDDLCRRYDESFDPVERAELIRQIDRLIFAEHPCVLGWRTPYIRLMYWNKFGFPPGSLGRTAGVESALRTWWIDPEKVALLDRAKSDATLKLDAGPYDVYR